MIGTPGLESSPVESPTHYRWLAPGKPLAVELSLTVVDDLLREVMRGFGAAPRRGVEVGGILLGTVSGQNPTVVRIDAFQPVACRHAKGPYFLLSHEELAAMRQAVERSEPSPERPHYAVGFYRSHIRHGLSLSETDLAMYDAFFPDPNNLVLLVKPFATRASVAGFFFREHGEVRADSPWVEFPFRRADLVSAILRDTRPKTVPQAPPAPPHTLFRLESETSSRQDPGEDLSRTAPARERRRRRTLLVAMSALFSGLACGAWVAFRFPEISSLLRRQAPYGLGLSATGSQALVQIRWDRQAAAIQDADSGFLTVDDSGEQRIVELTPDLLRRGSVTYERRSPKLRIHMFLVVGKRHSISEVLDYEIPK